MKKLLSLALAFVFSAALFALPMVGTAAEGDLAIDFNDGSIASFTGGTVALDAKTGNPYLSVGSGESASVVLPGALTVDFKLKVQGDASVAAGGAELSFSEDEAGFTENGASKSASFVSGLWYNLRLTANGTNAELYIDGMKMGAVDGAGASFTSLSITGAAGVDDVKAYVAAQEGSRDMEATLLDFRFDGFSSTTTTTTATISGKEYPLQTIMVNSCETTKNVGNEKPLFANFTRSLDFKSDVSGIYGKSTEDKSGYFYHETNTSQAGSFDSTMDFKLGKNAVLNTPGDTQVISFNLAFPEDASNRAMTVRGHGLFRSASNAGYPSSGEVYAHGKIGVGGATNNATTGSKGWIIQIQGDRVYFFGDTTFYAVIPALTPEQWNHIRLEISMGDGTVNALTYKAYINDVEIVSDGAVAADNYYIRHSTNTSQYISRAYFWGIHQLSFNYNWGVQSDYSTDGGFYIDDVNVTNYYGSAPEQAVSPLYVDEGYTTPASTGESYYPVQENWDHDKWVSGNVVYVDGAMTLQSYADQLDAGRRAGDVIFRDSAGQTIADWSQPIGDLTYMEITMKNHERRIIGLIGESKLLSEYEGTAGTSLTPGTWVNSGSNAVLGSDDAGGGREETAASLTAAAGKAEPSLRYVLSPRYSDASYIYTDADRYRPVTFEFSALMPAAEDGYLRFCGRYLNGPKGAANNNLTSSFEKNFIILEGGEVRMQGRSNSSATTLLGHYTPGEWNHFAVTYYPGIQTNRVDIRVNGQYVSAEGNITKNWSGALMLAARNIKLQSMEEFVIYYRNAADDSQQVTSKVLLDKLKVKAGYYRASEKPALSGSGQNLIVFESTVTPLRAMNAQELGAELSDGVTGTFNGIYTDGTYTAKAEGVVKDGNRIVVQNGDLVRYYTVSMPAISVSQRDSGNNPQPVEGNTVAAGREVIVSAPGIEKGQLFLAVYEDAGCQRLLWANTDYSASLDTPRVGTVDFPLQDGNVIKAFYFAPGGGLQPVLPVKVLTVVEE